MSKTFWMIAAALFCAMTAISQWHLNTNEKLHQADTDGWLYVTKALSQRLGDELLYSEKLESIIIDLDIKTGIGDEAI